MTTSLDDYRGFVENFLHKTYTIGGEIIFPKHTRSINQARGVNPLICDRFDLTLECIRRYYAGVSSPLYEVLCGDGRFFDLFGDFWGVCGVFREGSGVCGGMEELIVVIWNKFSLNENASV